MENNPINGYLSAMAGWSASDLFLDEDRSPAVRVHGKVRLVEEPVTTREVIQSFLEQTLSPTQMARFEEDGDLDAGFGIEAQRRIRLNVSRQQGRLSIVARALPAGTVTFEALGLPGAIESLANKPRGLVLLTGATGSGKSTSLAAMVHHINQSRPARIVTIEDPIEFVHADILSRVSQREVGADTMSFHEALRHVVRQSPDVIVIGEIRDSETASIALAAAMTGHLVLATLHTIDATQTLQRILSLFTDQLRGQAALDLSLALQGIVSQRLIATAAGTGRVVAAELLTMTPAAARLVREERVEELPDLMRASSDPGMRTFTQSLIKLYKEEKISFEDGYSFASNADEFSLMAKGMHSGVEVLEDDVALNTLDMKALLRVAQKHGASDLHISVGRPPTLRINGVLAPLSMDPLTSGDLRLLLHSILTGRQRSIFELEREIDFALTMDGEQRFRVNAYYHRGYMAASLRAIATDIPNPEVLMLPPVILKLAEKPQGLLLVVGPTGSGKSTTMACMVNRINQTRPCRIITVEDPVEYIFTGAKATIDQREVGEDTLSYAAALKHVLRQDPDVIMLGEMRDLETISAALTAAETGHLVLATLHTNDAIQAIDRMVDVFPPAQQSQIRAQVAASLVGVISQRLLPRADQKGRLAVFELMIANHGIRNLIRDNKMHQAAALIETGHQDGMITMDKAIGQVYRNRWVTYDAALRHVSSPNILNDL